MHIDHINIKAPMDLLVEVKDFYCRLFNLSDGFRPDFPDKGFWLYTEDKPIVHLSESNSHHPVARRGYLDHIAFQATGLDEMIKRLELLGLKYSLAHIPEIRLTQIFLNDPAGTGLEVNFPDEKSGENL